MHQVLSALCRIMRCAGSVYPVLYVARLLLLAVIKRVCTEGFGLYMRFEWLTSFFRMCGGWLQAISDYREEEWLRL